MGIYIRPAGLADRPLIDGLLSAVYPRLLLDDYDGHAVNAILPLLDRANPKLLESGSYYMLFERLELVAVGGWTATAPGEDCPEGTGHVRHVATHPDHLKKGHASRLMRHIRDKARAGGVRRLDCLSSLNARPFYARQGFDDHGIDEAPIAPGITFPVVRMAAAI
ncbi:GNAT family N-acetyltransferase [Jannaschia ovalis]|uniref:GNAT family N-acetyltransferase n=1 Tax=Jannaschia ovalis TaxID=3038773 RepID=A0ABY8LCE0_9RHOB|nr:GNAT family N-acetyltransferase [Jannaschia sp. GRR-S6-38]WGH77819.1 GNAT family N-acetyltransferase [Jannaschia sp. GRR-S6-38]